MSILVARLVIMKTVFHITNDQHSLQQQSPIQFSTKKNTDIVKTLAKTAHSITIVWLTNAEK